MPGVSASLPARGDSPAADGPNGAESRAGGEANGQSGDFGQNSSVLGHPSGDYSLDTLPDGILSGRSSGAGAEADAGSGPAVGAGDRDSAQTAGGAGSGGAMTTSERAAVLDEQLRRGYEAFDGFILGERERAQAETNAGGASAQPGAEEAGGAAGQMPQVLEAPGASGGVQVATEAPPMPGSQNSENFPPPEDIPSGRDDDVVARQLREAAMTEPDPELREALWDEYRNYTGLSDN